MGRADTQLAATGSAMPDLSTHADQHHREHDRTGVQRVSTLRI